ncbi:hypothetical protein GE09DRAFT_1278227 [Coniochaeta sp. 2T2.1]|nr:hypothetical protein GE09DRAFT_1278227 [Coniochaeta sp. 2T2.1]
MDIPSRDHHGNCHCGSYRFKVRLPHHHAQIVPSLCDCRLCQKRGYQWWFRPASAAFEVTRDDGRLNAWVGIYPRLSEVKVTGTEHLTDYRFGRKFMGHPFCRVCGVHVVTNAHGPPQDVVDQLPDGRREMVRKKLDVKPVNVMVLEGVDLSLMEVERTDEGTEGYARDVLGLTG